MSITIYHGMKYEGDILSLQKELLSIRKEVQKEIDNELLLSTIKYIGRVIEYSVQATEKEMLDFISVHFDEGTDMSYVLTLSLYGLARFYMKSYYDTFYTEQSVMVYPFTENEIYLYPLGTKIVKNKFMENGNFQNYGFWNNVDREEGVSDEEWSERECIWNEIFKRSETTIFGHAGFSFQLYLDRPDRQELSNYELPETFIENVRRNPKFSKDKDFNIKSVFILNLKELLAK